MRIVLGGIDVLGSVAVELAVQYTSRVDTLRRAAREPAILPYRLLSRRRGSCSPHEPLSAAFERARAGRRKPIERSATAPDAPLRTHASASAGPGGRQA